MVHNTFYIEFRDIIVEGLNSESNVFFSLLTCLARAIHYSLFSLRIVDGIFVVRVFLGRATLVRVSSKVEVGDFKLSFAFCAFLEPLQPKCTLYRHFTMYGTYTHECFSL